MVYAWHAARGFQTGPEAAWGVWVALKGKPAKRKGRRPWHPLFLLKLVGYFFPDLVGSVPEAVEEIGVFDAASLSLAESYLPKNLGQIVVGPVVLPPPAVRHPTGQDGPGEVAARVPGVIVLDPPLWTIFS